MNLKRLRELIEKTKHLPGSTPVLKSGNDHNYIWADIELGEALYNAEYDCYDETYSRWKPEDTPNSKVVEAIIVSQY